MLSIVVKYLSISCIRVWDTRLCAKLAPDMKPCTYKEIWLVSKSRCHSAKYVSDKGWKGKALYSQTLLS